MKISTLIKKLSALQKEHGDIMVFNHDMYGILDVNLLQREVEQPPEEFNMPKKWVSILTVG